MKILNRKYHITSSLAIIIILLFTSCYGPFVEGDGNVVERNRDVSGFNKIEISGGYKVYISEANRESLRIVADENLHEHIVTKVINNRLIIENNINFRKAKKREIYLEVKSIDNIFLSGAIDFKGKTVIKAETLNIDANGAVEIDLEVRANKIISEFSGACEIYLSGKAEKVSIRASGGVEIEAYELIADRFNLIISGAGYAAVNAREELDVRVSGAAKVRYKGNPVVRKNIRGAASLRKY